ncbi:MAG: hypothetical protein IPH61_15220 [Bacteroidetes bacterium]|nr:hypothetical protein [Bacteroidota bacterium]
MKEYVQDGPDVYAGVGFGGPYYYGGFSAPIYQSDVREVTSNEGMLVIENVGSYKFKITMAWMGFSNSF